MDKKYKLAITIVNYNTKELSLYCLKNIIESNITIPYQIVFLDNHSIDQEDTIYEISRKFPDVKIIKMKYNSGYTKGVNQVIKHTNAEYIFNINSDVILKEGVVEKMVKYLENNKDVGIIGPQLLNFDGSIQESAYRFITPDIALYRRTFLGLLPFAKKKLSYFTMKDWDHTTTREVDWVLGAAIMFPKKVMDEIGHLDEDMFLYLSDTYLAWKLWENSYKVIYYPEVKIYHYHRKSSRDENFIKKLFFNRAYKIHIKDGFTYFKKTFRKFNPRLIK